MHRNRAWHRLQIGTMLITRQHRGLFKLRSILLVVMLMVVLLPLAGLYFFRIYENELVRQTEQELISQSAVLSASFRQLVRLQYPQQKNYGRKVNLLLVKERADKYQPIYPRLNLIDPIQPPRPPGQVAVVQSDPIAEKIGLLLRQVMRDTQQITLSGIRLLDMNGIVIAGQDEVGLSLAHVPEVNRALQGYYASTIRQRISDEPPPPLYSVSRGTNIRVFIALPVLENQHLQGVVYLSRTPSNILKHLFSVRDKVLIASLILLALVVMLVMFVSSAISMPIRELMRQTERVKQGEQQWIEPLNNPVTHEMAQLSDSFAGMSQALFERTDYIQRFATHVSHEFKTPLTSMQGALELLQDHLETMTSAQLQQFIGNLLTDTQRLKQLVNRLLELARADALEPSVEQSQLTDVIGKLQTRYQARGLSLQLDQLPSTNLAIAPDALELVLVNLLENSLQHGANQVRLTAEYEHNVLKLQVHDNGAGISEANRNKIFTPFFTTRRNSGGTGLGLEISQSLLKAYGGKIELLPSEQGALFELQLVLSKNS